MKDNIVCYQCKEEFVPRKDERQRCPRCGTWWWMTPTLWDRIRAAWWVFWSPW